MKRQRIRKGIIIVSFLLLPVSLYYFSPDLILEGAFAGVATGSMVMFALLFLFSLLFGRAFCGWVCPVGGLQESLAAVTVKKPGARQNRVKYFIWAPWLAGIVAGLVAAGGVNHLDIFYRTDHGISVSDIHSLIIYLIVISLITVLALTAGRRSFCHCACWMAPLMVIGTKIKDCVGYPSLHLRAEPDKCTRCKQCTKMCPMSLDVDEMVKRRDMRNPECILCGECVDGCPRKAICFQWTKPSVSVSDRDVCDGGN